MDNLIIGRTLDDNGNPVSGTGLKIDQEGKVAEVLQDTVGPLVSNPVSQEWVSELVPAEETGGEYLSALYIIAGEGPPLHYHVGYEETFEVLKGELTIDYENTSHSVTPGETHTIASGTVHKPRYDGNEFAAAIGSVRPAAKTLELLMTMFGLTHEGKVDESGQPDFLQGMVMADGFANDTVFVSPPPTITKALSIVISPLSRLLGYQSTYSEYEAMEFWKKHVEQPKL